MMDWEMGPVRRLPNLGSNLGDRADGAVAQLGENLLSKQGVSGSIPLSSTKSIGVETDGECLLKKNKVCIGESWMPVLHTL
jgi:hypothetical protein